MNLEAVSRFLSQLHAVTQVHPDHPQNSYVCSSINALTLEDAQTCIESASLAVLEVVTMIEAGYKGFAENGPQHRALRSLLA